MPTALLTGGQRVQTTSTITVPGWHDITGWTHSWDVADAVTYVPSAAEQANYGITAAPRVSYIPDRGTGGKPMWRDTTTYGSVYGTTMPLPGPLHVPASCAFQRRPAMQFRKFEFDSPSMRPIMTAQVTPFTAADYFNTPGGYTVPYYVAIAARAPLSTPTMLIDSILGSDVATISLSTGGQLTDDTHYTVAAYTGFNPNPVLASTHTFIPNESVVILIGVASGAMASEFTSYARTANGALYSTVTSGTLNPNPLRELFLGWHHTLDVAAVGIKVGTFDLGARVGFVTWAQKWLTPGSDALPAGT